MSYQLPVTSYQLPVLATGNWQLATGNMGNLQMKVELWQKPT
jgi:hypothetical protein